MQTFKVDKVKRVVSYAYIKADSFADAEEIAEMYPDNFEFDHEVEEFTAEVAE